MLTESEVFKYLIKLYSCKNDAVASLLGLKSGTSISNLGKSHKEGKVKESHKIKLIDYFKSEFDFQLIDELLEKRFINIQELKNYINKISNQSNNNESEILDMIVGNWNVCAQKSFNVDLTVDSIAYYKMVIYKDKTFKVNRGSNVTNKIDVGKILIDGNAILFTCKDARTDNDFLTFHFNKADMKKNFMNGAFLGRNIIENAYFSGIILCHRSDPDPDLMIKILSNKKSVHVFHKLDAKSIQNGFSEDSQ